jgi:hypothetical protein
VLRKGGQFGDTFFEERGDAGVFKAREPKGANIRLTAGKKLRMQRRKGGKKRDGTGWRKRLNGAYGQRGSRVERAHRPHVVQTLSRHFLNLLLPIPHALQFTLALAFTTLRNRHRENRVINVRKN